MSFAKELVDALPLLYKRTEGTLKSTHEIASFLNKLTILRRDHVAKVRGLIAAYAQRKLLVNTSLDGTVKKAVAKMVEEMEGSLALETAYTNRLTELSAEIESFRQKQESVRRKLQVEGETMVRDLNNQYEANRRAKANYVALSREAEKQQVALVKVQESTKSSKLAAATTRASSATERARAAESEYRECVRATNDCIASVYNTRMPVLLGEFQTCEEERIRFVKERLSRHGAHVQSEFPQFYTRSAQALTDSAAAIDIAADIAEFVSANRTGHTQPAPAVFEPYTAGQGMPPAQPPPPSPLGSSNNAPSSPGSHSYTSSEIPPATLLGSGGTLGRKSMVTEPVQAASSAMAIQASMAASAPAPVQAAPQPQPQPQPQQPPPSPQTQAQAPPPEQAPPSSDGQDFDGPDPIQVHLRVRALFDYEATCETEMSFRGGDILIVSEQDSSGWWFATKEQPSPDGTLKEGFIPQNYVEVLSS